MNKPQETIKLKHGTLKIYRKESIDPNFVKAMKTPKGKEKQCKTTQTTTPAPKS